MKKRYRFSLMITILLCFSFMACKSAQTPDNTQTADRSSPPPGESGQQSAEVVEMPNFEIVSDMKNAYEYEFSEFDLGDRSYPALSGREMPYRLRGIMAVPVGAGPFPIVLITHGSHENLDETKRFDTGYDYLVKALAHNGYIAISMDMLMPYIWTYGDSDDMEKSIAVADEHIQSVLEANSGKTLYTVDFSGKSALSIHIVPDSASVLNQTDEALRFTVILRNADGNTAAVVTAANQNVLSCYPGGLGKTELTDVTIEYWQPTTPLGMLNIPLTLFKGIDFAAIETVELFFDQTGSGAVFIDAIEVQ